MTRPTDKQESRPRVLILGAGFAGVSAVKALRDAPVDITLVDRNGYNTFQPLLYQVATGVEMAGSLS
jgi:NADH dehydrogenase